MQPMYSDHYHYDEDDPSITLRVDYFEELEPKAWLEVNGMYAVPLNPSQLCVLRLMTKDASQDVDEWLMEERGSIDG